MNISHFHHDLPFRFHTFSIYEESSANKYEDSLIKGDNDSGFSSHGKHKRKSVNGIDYRVREDVMKIWEELDTAKTTLAEIQALLVEFDNPQRAKQGIKIVRLFQDTLEYSQA